MTTRQETILQHYTKISDLKTDLTKDQYVMVVKENKVHFGKFVELNDKGFARIAELKLRGKDLRGKDQLYYLYFVYGTDWNFFGEDVIRAIYPGVQLKPVLQKDLQENLEKGIDALHKPDRAELSERPRAESSERPRAKLSERPRAELLERPRAKSSKRPRAKSKGGKSKKYRK
jgi:hypothetical protein